MPIASVSLNNLAKDLWTKIASTNQNDIDALGDAIDQSTRGTGIPQVMAAGMVLNPKNITKLGKLAKMLMSDKALTTAEKAYYIARAKYPKLTAQVPINFLHSLEDGPNFKGQYDWNKREIDVSTKNIDDLSDAINSILHETVHARQDRHGTLAQRYITYMPWLRNKAQVINQPLEQAAIKGGNTAQATYNRLMQLIGQ